MFRRIRVQSPVVLLQILFLIIISPQNLLLASEAANDLVRSPASSTSSTSTKMTAEQAETKKLELLMERARQAMVKHDYRSAIASYTAVTRFEGTDFFQAALEYLGLARERNKQFAHAKAEYERYLRLYPDSEDAIRVQQRLTGLLSAAYHPKRKLRKSKVKKSSEGWLNYGSFMQFYRHDRDLNRITGDFLSSSTLYSSFFYTAKLKNSRYEIKNRVSMSHNFDFQENDEDNDLLKISKLYSEIYAKRLKLTGRIGRQVQNNSGAYGRFDGAVLAYHYNPRLTLRASSGFPVDFDSYDTIQSNKHFYSINAEVESLFGYVDVSTYFVTQYFDEVLDRRAIGIEFRHFDRKMTFFTTVDYDISYSVINNMVVNVNYKLKPKHRLGTYLTFRRSPLLTTTNALQGQAVSQLRDLLESKTKDELRELARDRSAEYISATISWQHKIDKKLEMNYDYTLSELTGTTTSGGVVGAEGTGFEHYYSSQLIATDIFRKYDVSIIGLRFENRFSSNRLNLNLIRRDRVNKKLMLGSRLRTDYQKRKSGEVIVDFSPSAKVSYKIRKKYKLEFELGFQHRVRANTFDENNETNGFFSLGYIAQL